MSDLDPRSDEAYRRASEMAADLEAAISPRSGLRAWLRLTWAWLRMWRASR